MRARALSAFVTALALAACSLPSGGNDDITGDFDDPGDCVVVDLAASPEKIDLLSDLATTFNGSDEARVGDKCVFVRPQRKSSGKAAQLLSQEWDESVEGPRPVVWSPAGSVWGQVVNQRLNDRGDDPIAGEFEPFMLTPLVIAMPEPMARAIGWPSTPIGWTDILDLARQKEGWGEFGHPEWGPFRLGKTNPNFSTSGLNALAAQTYAAAGKTSGLSSEDIQSDAVKEFSTGVESAVVHYGDTTLTFLNNLYRADRGGSALTYVSAVAVEEKSVIDYNRGNPDGILDSGEKPRPPRVKLVAIYPKEGTLFSDNPFYVLDASWVDDDERRGAALFEDFVKRPRNQEQVLEFGFRPGNTEVPLGQPINAENGVDPAQPQTLLEVPSPPVLVDLIESWDLQRKKARVLLVLDVSGSMREPADPDDPDGPTKLDLAKQAAIDSLALFSPDDEVGLRIFSTNLGDNEDLDFLDLVPYGRVGEQGEAIANRIRDVFPTNATPLYAVTESSYRDALAGFDAGRINAVVILTDGKNDDGTIDDDDEQFAQLVASLRSGNEGNAAQPVRLFPIAYGTDADLDALRGIAEASTGAVYNATDPATINAVLTAVISNF